MNGSSVDNFVLSVNRKDAPRRRNNKEINCLWASRIGGRIVGLVHLVGAERRAVSITLFRVAPEYRHTAILTNLIDRVRDYCRGRGCLVVHIEPHLAPQWVLRQFEARGLRRICPTDSDAPEAVDFRVDPLWAPAAPPPLGARRHAADDEWPAAEEPLELAALTS